VDNFPKPGSEDEAAAFDAWAIEQARKSKARNLRAYANTIMADPKRLEEFRASLAPPPTKSDFVPDLKACPTCGGVVRTNRFDGLAECQECQAWFHYDRAFDQWLPDSHEIATG
jgi:hypothetical protein